MVLASRPGSGRRHRPTSSRARGRIAAAAAGAMVLVAGSAMSIIALSSPAEAASTVTTLTPARLTTTAGATGGQPVTALQVKDLSASTDDWNRYVELGGESAGRAYSGYAQYQLPAATTPNSVTGLRVDTNYRGPGADDQVWTWSLYDWTTGAWSPVGTNAGVRAWGAWTSLAFSPVGGASAYASAAGEIRVRVTSSNARDNADLDYLAVVVTSSVTGTPTTTPTPTSSAPATTPAAPGLALPPANAVWDYQIGGSYTPAAAVGIVDRDHTEAPAAGKYNVCYVNAYQTQPGDSKAWPSAALLHTAGGQLVEDADWPGEYMVDTRTAASRTAVMSVVGPWIDSCAAKGFRGVEVDNLDSYTRDPSTQLSEAGNVALAKLIVARGHSKQVTVGQKNTVELAGIGKSQIGFDFAVAESCQRWNECDGYTDVYGTQVYEVEYVEEGGQANWQKACDARGARISITYRDRLVVPAGSPGYTFRYC